ncbi:MFS transporter [Gryllotalpicola koreensis]|uniref:MFS transporter n=1 Tax=Gryllotalpicola koreensis TaxID=993086 RepID=A0ABP8ACF2_9MICO
MTSPGPISPSDPLPAAAPLTQPIATTLVGPRYQVGLFLAQFGLFAALLTPVMVSMQLKAQQIDPAHPATVIGTVLPIGAFGALLANPLAGALSDRTRTRWGRRRPWMIGGIVVFLGALAWIAFADSTIELIFAWLLGQVAANAAFAALTASFADNVPEIQRARSSSVIALAQNIAILAGTYLSVFLVSQLPLLFIIPGIVAVIFIVVYAAVCRDELPEYPLKRFTLVNIVSSFWTNPFKNPDFGFAWWSRFLIIFATFMFTTYRLLYMEDHIGLSTAKATSAIAFGVLLYTIVLMAAAAVSGWLSDKLGRRKIFVGGSTALTALGLIVLAHSSTVGSFYVAEVIMGAAYGIYSAVDTALVVDVLPNADRPGKDLGVLNIANALPQSLAPALAAFLLGVGSATQQNYTLMLWGAGVAAILGALAIIPVKKVR